MSTGILHTVHTRRKTSKSNVKCSVYGCTAVNRKNPELSFHRFPKLGDIVSYTDSFGEIKQAERKKLWEIKLKMGKPVTPHMYVCSRHFKHEDYITPNEDCYARRVLKRTVVPTQNLPQTSFSLRKTKIQEERLLRLEKRRKISKENSCSTNVDTDQNINLPSNNESCNVKSLEAAEALLSLHEHCDENVFLQTSFGQPLNISVSTQTEETYFVNDAKSFKDEGVQVQTAFFSISDFITSENILKILTGLPSFVILGTLTTLYLNLKKDERIRKLAVKDRIILVFMKLKLDLTFTALSVLFGVSLPTVKNIFSETILVLYDILKCAIVFPSKEEIAGNIPLCFQKFPNIRIILDCTEIHLQHTKKLCCRVKSYSHYKQHTTIKFMTGVTPGGLISFVSKGYGGRASDKAIFEQSNVLDSLEPYRDQIMVDKGFLIDNLCNSHGITIVRPPFLRKKKQFNKNEAQSNVNIASARVHIERMNARIKVFKIFKNTFPIHLLPLVTEMFTIVCGICNLSPPILADKAFL